MALSCSKKLSALLREITSKHYGDFYCLNCFYSLSTKNKLKSHKRVCENKYFYNIIMASEDTNILEFNQYEKSGQAQFVIYADLECLIKRIDGYKNNLEKSSIKNKQARKHISSGFSMSTIVSFRSIENKHDICRGKACIKRFCESLREHVTKIINFKKKKMKLLIKEQYESYKNGKICYICKEKIENKYVQDKKYCKVRGHCHYTG